MKKLITILLFLISSVSFATKYYVSSTTGDNGDSGQTEALAWATLDYAEDNATTAGDTIALERGNTFSLASSLVIDQQGSSGNHIIWDGNLWGTGDDAIIQIAAACGLYAIHFDGSDYVTFQNITLDGNEENSWGYYIDDGVTHITIQDCEIKDIGPSNDYCIAITLQPSDNDVTDILIKDNHIHDISAHAIAVYVMRSDILGHEPAGENKDILITGNTLEDYRIFTGNSGSAVIINNSCDGVTVEHNTITVNSFLDVNLK